MKDLVASEVDPDDVTEELIAAHLYNPDIPDPDLMVRTAGEMRWSNFLLWQSAYTELYVTDQVVARVRRRRASQGDLRLPEADAQVRRGSSNRRGLRLAARLLQSGMAQRRLWSRDELVVVLDFYVRKGYDRSDPELNDIAELIGRTRYSVDLRLANFVHVDPGNPLDGMAGGQAQCEPIFKEFGKHPKSLRDEGRRIHAPTCLKARGI